MAKDFTCFQFSLDPTDPWRDLLISDLGELGFDTFEETESGFKAYSDRSVDDEVIAKSINEYKGNCQIAFEKEVIPEENWNRKWEESFEPVIVEGKCILRADFHEVKEKYPYEIILNPKMSFGTGHHSTTYLMIKRMLNYDASGLKVLDMGSGTGVLAILASKMGAHEILAIDNDDWAFENSLENLRNNSTENVNVEKGSSELLEGRAFNIILANINKNVLLEDLVKYARALMDGGKLLISGFYENDIKDLQKNAESIGLTFNQSDTLNKWAAIEFIK